MAGLLNLGEMSALALHVMKRLAVAKEEDALARISAADIAAGLRASPHTLHKVVARLVNAGLVDSARGPSGGVRLADGAEKATLLAVVEAVDGPSASNGCLLAKRVCAADEHCVFHSLTCELENHIRNHLTASTVGQLVNDSVNI